MRQYGVQNHMVFKICQFEKSKTLFYSTLTDADEIVAKESKLTLIKK